MTTIFNKVYTLETMYYKFFSNNYYSINPFVDFIIQTHARTINL